jgi:phosphoribosylamine-glycine ligase
MLEKLEGRDTLRVGDGVAIGVVLALPPFPYDTHLGSDLEGIPIYGLTERNAPHISLSSVMAGKAPNDTGKIVDLPVSAGTYLCVVHQTGKTVGLAQARTYKVVGELEVPANPLYRTDIGDRLEEQLPILQTLGYATDMEYE